MTDVKLLPCPFCGASATLRHNYQWWVQCGECGASTSDSAPMDRAGASAAWNRRANVAHATEPLKAEIEELRAIIDNREAIIATHAADTREYQKQIMHAEARAERLEAEVEAWRELSDHVRAGACNAIWPDRYTDARTRDVAAALKRAEGQAEFYRTERNKWQRRANAT